MGIYKNTPSNKEAMIINLAIQEIHFQLIFEKSNMPATIIKIKSELKFIEYFWAYKY